MIAATSIETKFPAPLVGAVVFACMRLYAHAAGITGDDSDTRTLVAIVIADLSGLVALAAFASFWRHRTTIDPFHPDRASTLVTHGVFRLSRNPMYLSMLLLLVAYAVRMGVVVEWLGPVAYCAWVTRYQIVPEERALSQRFGERFREYQRRTRRWL